jgi:DNA-binding transcriptional ArsR family regulator
MDTVPPVRVRMLGALRDGAKITAAEIGRRTGTDRKVARRALEDLRALGITSCPAEDGSEDEDTSGTVWVEDQTEEGKTFMRRVPKIWMYSSAADADSQDRVNLVRKMVRKLLASADTVPKSGDIPPHPPETDTREAHARGEYTYTSERDNGRSEPGPLDWENLARMAKYDVDTSRMSHDELKIFEWEIGYDPGPA